MKKSEVSNLCFDDILLVPQTSNVESRHEVRLTMSIGKGKNEISLYLPVIAAPMDSVCGFEMCMVMADSGALGILHRYMSKDEQIQVASDLAENEVGFGVAIASNNGFIEQAKKLYDVGVKLFVIDTANGHGIYTLRAASKLREDFPDVHIMAGNVSTVKGFKDLADCGVDSVRVGIGGGAACTTRLVSGHGVPTLASVMDIEEYRENRETYECSIIADGGIRNSGDMVKAFAAGADAVMVGSILAGTTESPGSVLMDNDGNKKKVFRGMASADAQMSGTGKISIPEGISTTVPFKGSAYDILTQIRGGIGSGCSYSGVDKLSSLKENAEYIEVSNASLDESRPHAL